jgi:hypothetical protein
LLDERSDLRSNDIISGLVTGLFARPGITTRFMSVEIDEIGYFDGIIVTVRQFRYPLEFVLWISIFDIYPMSASPATGRKVCDNLVYTSVCLSRDELQAEYIFTTSANELVAILVVHVVVYEFNHCCRKLIWERPCQVVCCPGDESEFPFQYVIKRLSPCFRVESSSCTSSLTLIVFWVVSL